MSPKELQPYKSDAETRQAVKRYNTPTIKLPERQTILKRLQNTEPDLLLPSLPDLLDALTSQPVEDCHTMLTIVEAITTLDLDTGLTIERLARHLLHKNATLRERIGTMLLTLAPRCPEVLPRVLRCLGDPSADMRITGARILAAMGPELAESAIPKIELQIRDNEPNVAAKQALMQTLEVLKGTAKDEAIPQGPPADQNTVVLVVEDEEFLRSLAKRLLQDHVSTVLEAENGKRALEILRSSHQQGQPVSAVLLDLMMPVLNGIELIKQVKADPVLADTPIVVCTAYGKRDVVNTALGLGVAGFVIKPYDTDELVKKVLSVLTR